VAIARKVDRPESLERNRPVGISRETDARSGELSARIFPKRPIAMVGQMLIFRPSWIPFAQRHCAIDPLSFTKL
jgi:hypothetical protein